MARNRVGDALLKRMEADGCWTACVMDGLFNDIACDLDLKLWKGMNPHPMNRATVAASYIARDERFTVGRFRAHDSAGRERVLRLYAAKLPFRTESNS